MLMSSSPAVGSSGGLGEQWIWFEHLIPIAPTAPGVTVGSQTCFTHRRGLMPQLLSQTIPLSGNLPPTGGYHHRNQCLPEVQIHKSEGAWGCPSHPSEPCLCCGLTPPSSSHGHEGVKNQPWGKQPASGSHPGERGQTGLTGLPASTAEPQTAAYKVQQCGSWDSSALLC